MLWQKGDQTQVISININEFDLLVTGNRFLDWLIKKNSALVYLKAVQLKHSHSEAKIQEIKI